MKYPRLQNEKKLSRKLSDKDYSEIFRLRKEGNTLRFIAQKFGVVGSTIFFILRPDVKKKWSAYEADRVRKMKGTEKYEHRKELAKLSARRLRKRNPLINKYRLSLLKHAPPTPKTK